MNLTTRNKINVTGGMNTMTDLVFLLLIFFMVSTSFVQNQALNVDLPQANGDAQPNEDLFINENKIFNEKVYNHNSWYYIFY